jgi:hypothetical protein
MADLQMGSGAPPAWRGLRVVSNDQMDAQQAIEDQAKRTAEDQRPNQQQYVGLSGYIRTQWNMMVRHRNTIAGWSDRLLAAMRAFNGQYDASKLAEIRRFGGSEVYCRLIAAKCRGASSLLRDVYLGADRPWALGPPEDPDVSDEVLQAVQTLVKTEVLTLMDAAQQGAGQPPSPSMVKERSLTLLDAAREAAKKKATHQCRIAEDKVDELLTEGGFYKALAEFLTDIPLFPLACIKGPTVRMVTQVSWVNGRPIQKQTPKLWWERISPFDIWMTPGVSDVEDAQIVERFRITRTDLNDLLDLPGYNKDNIRYILEFYGMQGITDDWDTTDASRAIMESRENPVMNESNMLTGLMFTGNVQGRMLRDYGFGPDEIPDELRDYSVQAWLIGNYLIKVQLNPSPRRRHNYYVTSWEKVPGTPIGNGLPDIISDMQEVMNATLRSLVNNMSIASGPQVVINDDRMSGQENSDELYPWKRWHATNPTVSGTQEKPVDFFQPQMNAQELLGVFNAFYGLADDISAIPKYLSGNSPGGGAGRTASGLAMLMGNASKLLQTVCANIDRDVMTPNLQNTLDMILLTDTTGLLTGQEEVVPKGVNVAMQKETMRARQLEFLQVTANPIDLQIIGPKGRANVLRAVSSTIGLDGEEIVPTEEALDQQQKTAQDQAAAGGVPGHAQGPPQPPGAGGPGGQQQPQPPGPPPNPQANPPPGPSQDTGPRANLFVRRPGVG